MDSLSLSLEELDMETKKQGLSLQPERSEPRPSYPRRVGGALAAALIGGALFMGAHSPSAQARDVELDQPAAIGEQQSQPRTSGAPPAPQPPALTDRQKAQALLRRSMPEFRRCIAQARASNRPDRISLQITLSANRRRPRVRFRDEAAIEPSVRACVLRTINSLQFPRLTEELNLVMAIRAR